MGGRGLPNGGNRFEEIIANDRITFNFLRKTQNWLDVCPILGPIVYHEGDTFTQLIDRQQFLFQVNNKSVSYWPYSKMDRFILSHLRGVANKTAYCFGCKACEVECPVNAFAITEENKIYIREEKCIHCSAIVGMATALRLCCERMNEVTARLTEMTSCFSKIINANIPEATFNGDSEHRLPGHISLSIPGISGEALMHVLDLKGIAVSTGAACDSRSTKISDVLKAIRLPVKLAKGTIRITLGAYNTVDQAQYIADKIVEYFRNVSK